MAKALTRRTVVVAGSAPGFPHGVIDPIPALSEMARERGIGFHTDACLGGFVLPWAERLGYDVPPFDFRLPGVTSMSADTHKYGYAAKGTSVVLYRGRDLRHHQFSIAGEPAEDNSKYANHDWIQNAEKVGVDHLIKFKAFDARDMPFEDNAFDAIFFLGSFHHVEEEYRVNVLQECIRTSTADGLIGFFEPNQNAMKIIMELDPSHPEAADPSEYTQGLNLKFNKIEGSLFDAFIFKK
jgi:SAM-dependent methyltransferase